MLTKTDQVQKQVKVTGLVQGVGFRPHVWHLAQKHDLVGEVLNNGHGVTIYIDGTVLSCHAFVDELVTSPPPLARIDQVSIEELVDEKSFSNFQIIETEHSEVEVSIVADAATCPACIEDIFDPENHRYQYPFTNCTHCGPRYSIVHGLPYDREQTSMASFTMCTDCQTEYDDPADRRFHAQPNACADCGPEVWLVDADGNDIQCQDPITEIAERIKAGQIIAIKGIGGYQLVCDATSHRTVRLLRRRKARRSKPFAMMAKSVKQIKSYCAVSDIEEKALRSPGAPIVLLSCLNDELPESIAPGHTRLGFVLPYSPLHHLLMDKLDEPVIFTSGNRSGLPQCTDNDDAEEKLAEYVDAFLHHNRDIVNRVDDSVISLFQDKPYFLRRSRGYSPTSITTPDVMVADKSILACGSQMKNTFSLYQQNHLICSQYIGDLESVSSIEDYHVQMSRQFELFEFKPDVVVVDMHPEYQATKFGKDLAQKENLPLVEVQHHHAHLAACLLENNHQAEDGPVVGLVMDGLGYGLDNTIWGGELLLGDFKEFTRLGTINTVRMPGGTQAILQPWRMLLAHYYQASLTEDIDLNLTLLKLPAFRSKPVQQIKHMLENDINSPLTSSCGRLFDAVAAMLGICSNEISYEGQAAIELQQLAMTISHDEDIGYEIPVVDDNGFITLDTSTLWNQLINDLGMGIQRANISYRFHLGLAKSLTQMASLACEQHQVKKVALCGGVFQNELLLKLCMNQLTSIHIESYIHRTLPANDACISAGQAIIAAHKIRSKPSCA